MKRSNILLATCCILVGFCTPLITCAPRRAPSVSLRTAPHAEFATLTEGETSEPNPSELLAALIASDPNPDECIAGITALSEVLGRTIPPNTYVQQLRISREIGFDALCAVGTNAQNQPGLHDDYLIAKSWAVAYWSSNTREECPCFRD